MMGYDAWLESPYTNRAREEAEFEAWAEKNLPDLDWDDNGALDEAWEKFEEARYEEQE